MTQFSVSIVITSKNRKDELANCIESCLKLNGVTEILIFDDGSTDSTYDMVRLNYPKVSLYRTETSLGLINARTHCASLAIGDIIVSVDDDCCFDHPDTLVEAIQYFSHAKIAAITIPAIDVLKSPEVTQQGIGDKSDIYICSQYRGCAHAVRKEIFLKLGGYYNNLVRQEEETEFAMRLYAAGYVIRVADCEKPILHYHSANRNFSTIAFYRARNKLLVTYRTSPVWIMPFEFGRHFFALLKYEIAEKQANACMKGFLDALKNIFQGKVPRASMPMKKFFFFKKLRLNGPLKINLDSI